MKRKQARKRINACYAHELFSNLCEPSRLPTNTKENHSCDRATLLFEERVDLDFGLLDKLLANGVLSGAQYADIKTSQSSLSGARNLLSCVQKKSADFVSALQQTNQQHLLNYVWSSCTYNKKCGGDWPLTDRQMMTLNVNQEVLVELMDMSPQLIDKLYSTDVLNKRQKDFICGQPSKLKQSETFLDILRRRSFRDYKETIRCLCASNQKHIADIFKRGVVGRIFCHLRKPVKNSSSTANRIVDKCSEELSRWSAMGGNCNLKLTKKGLIDVRYDKGLVIYFHFKNQKELSQTREIFTAGKMKALAEADFKALLPADCRSIHVKLEWSSDDFKRCDTCLRSRPFAETNIQNCSMAVLEIILSKAYAALCFCEFHSHPTEKKLIASLSSVSRDWHQTIARRWFKSSLTKCLSTYFQMVSKRNTIIRSNRKYLLENMEPTDILIDKMVKVGCLTKEKSDFVARLQHNTEKNEELLDIARSLSFKKHFAFIESLHSCGQLTVANVIEKGGVVVIAKIINTKGSDSAEFVKRVNVKIRELNEDHLKFFNEALVLDKEGTVEMLEVKSLERRRQNQSSLIYLWCKSQTSMRKLWKLLESSELLDRFDFLISCLNSTESDSLNGLTGSDIYKIRPRQFRKRLTIDAMQFKKEVAVRRMSLLRLGSIDLPQHIIALTTLDDKIYVLLDHLVSVHQDNPPFACVAKIVFPPPELQTTSRSHSKNSRYFMAACDETKCVYIANVGDSGLWKLTTPDYELKVWMSDIGNPFSLYVATNGNVVFMKQENDRYARICMDIFNKDAGLVLEIFLPNEIGMQPDWAMEMSPGKLVFSLNGKLLMRVIDLTTFTAHPGFIWLLKRSSRWRNETISGVTSYREGQFLMLLSKELAVIDSQLNVDIIPTSARIDANQLHYKKDKRQLIFWSHGRSTVDIYTLAYKAEDMFAGDP